MSELKPCPFCGGEAERKSIKPYQKIKGHGQSYLAVVGCSKFGCTAQVHQAAFDRETAWGYAENLWNRRAQPASEPLVRCEECVKYQTRDCAAKHEQALTDFCSHGISKPEGSEDQ